MKITNTNLDYDSIQMYERQKSEVKHEECATLLYEHVFYVWCICIYV